MVPTVDIGSPTATSLDALRTACADHGFFLLRGHGLDALIEKQWDTTRRFFECDSEIKESVRRSETSALGYFDRELTKRLRDNKEVFDFVDPLLDGEHQLNQWPAEPPGFESTMAEYFDAFAQLAATTLDLIYSSLDLSPEIAGQHRNARHSSTVRLNHYPLDDPVPAQDRGDVRPLGDVALGHHTDPGVLTLLLQDGVGGLQAESEEHGWIDVEPKPGTIVVNLADMLQVWTNDRYKAAVHRVIPITKQSRYSIPFFSNPARSAQIQPIDSLVEGSPKYREFSWRDFMQGRVDDNYVDLGGADIQISNFRV